MTSSERSVSTLTPSPLLVSPVPEGTPSGTATLEAWEFVRRDMPRNLKAERSGGAVFAVAVSFLGEIFSLNTNHQNCYSGPSLPTTVSPSRAQTSFQARTAYFHRNARLACFGAYDNARRDFTQIQLANGSVFDHHRMSSSKVNLMELRGERNASI
ncbi:hypothetical protein AC579_2109 [Pseudocercospora musae]|uniref:Uncharacterized protein n=1 Tax=Pseudocercospora musae TaxID=113226 RepID=A0A139GTG6_9PEZI|nr:hypothetical protein AC579_2109 [Pseudocercospora musae]